jgi:hypothetical protein
MVKCGDWGCRPNPDWSHINVKHIQCVWQPSYAVNVQMDVSLLHYSCSCGTSFWKGARILGGPFWVTPRQQMLVKCIDWGCRPNPDWSHVNVKHIFRVSQPSHAVDVHMDVSLPHNSCFGSELEFWVTPRRNLMLKCDDWGCTPIPDWSHINVKYIW